MVGKVQQRKWIKEILKDEVSKYGFKLKISKEITGGFTLFREDLFGYDYIYFDQSSFDKLIISLPVKRINIIHEKLFDVTGFYRSLTNTGLSKQTISTKYQMQKYLEPLKDNFCKYVEELDKYNDIHEVLNIWEKLQSGDERGGFVSNSYCEHIIYFLSKLFNEELSCMTYSDAVRGYKREIDNGYHIFKQHLQDIEKVKSYFEQVSIEEIEVIKKILLELPKRNFMLKKKKGKRTGNSA